MAFFLQMAAQSNLGFENWNGSDPASWTTSNELSMDGGGIQTVFRETSNPGQGNSSLKLVTGSCPECPNFGLGFMTLPFPDPIGGFVELGEIGDEGIPYTKRPISVDFMYKSNPMMLAACMSNSPATTPKRKKMKSSVNVTSKRVQRLMNGQTSISHLCMLLNCNPKR